MPTILVRTLAASVVVALSASMAIAQTYHRGYTRQDGTYVQPHYQSTPDRSYNNNWSVSPNVNPYTGQQGTRQPTFNDRPPQQYGSPQPYQQPSPYGSNNRRY